MTKSAESTTEIPAGTIETKAPRPFLFLEPRSVSTRPIDLPAADIELLNERASPVVPAIVRSVVNFTIALQNRRALEHGNVQPIAVSVLNRRRRAARAWLNAILAGQTDASTCHAVASQWLPLLCGTGPKIEHCIGPALRIVEFLRGALTATIFDSARENLVPDCKALNVLESVLAAHIGALQIAGTTGPRHLEV